MPGQGCSLKANRNDDWYSQEVFLYLYLYLYYSVMKVLKLYRLRIATRRDVWLQ